MSVHTVQYEGIEIEYELTRKNVKYINLRVNKHGKVVVSAGEQVPFAVIDEFVQSKAFWIITHLAEIEKIRNEISDASDKVRIQYASKFAGSSNIGSDWNAANSGLRLRRIPFCFPPRSCIPMC